MGGARRAQWERIDHASPVAFAVGGILWLFVVVSLLSGSFIGVSIPDELSRVFALSGSIAAMVGLLGFYPRLVNERPFLTRMGGVVVGLGLISSLILLLFTIGVAVQPRIAAGLSWNLFLIDALIALGLLLGFSLFGWASLRTANPSRLVGSLLLMIPVTIFMVFFGGATGFDLSRATYSVLALFYPLAILAIAVILWKGGD